MQLGAIFMDQVVFNVELPQAEAEVLPGVPWGAMEAFPTPAYWAYQVYARRLTGNRINYKLGATLQRGSRCLPTGWPWAFLPTSASLPSIT